MIEITVTISRDQNTQLVGMELSARAKGTTTGEAAFAREIMKLLSEGPQVSGVKKVGEWRVEKPEQS